MGGAPAASARRTGVLIVTVVWLVVWFICDRIGDRESLTFDPVNAWAATLVLAAALDLNRPGFGRKPR